MEVWKKSRCSTPIAQARGFAPRVGVSVPGKLVCYVCEFWCGFFG